VLRISWAAGSCQKFEHSSTAAAPVEIEKGVTACEGVSHKLGVDAIERTLVESVLAELHGELQALIRSIRPAQRSATISRHSSTGWARGLAGV
jgi:hypothetical protein